MKKISIGIIISILCLTIAFMYLQEKTTNIIKIEPPKIETTIGAVIKSIQAQSRLSVMTARVSSVATTKASKWAMTAKRTDIAMADVRFELDLSKITLDNIERNGNDLIITLPKVEISKPSLVDDIEVYDNGSLLLTDSLNDTMKKKNRTKIDKEFVLQAKELLPMANQAAKKAIEPMFNLPLKASGSTVNIIIR